MDDRKPDHYGHETVSSGFSVSQEARSDSLIFAYYDGLIAGDRGQPRSAPAGLSEDAVWTWLSAYDHAAREKS